MKIFYAIQGTGNGHISRGRSMAKSFRELGADVTYAFSGRPRDAYFDMEIFGDFQSFHGLSFKTHNGKIDYAGTIKSIRPIQFIRDVKSLSVDPYDIVITDFEPVTAWAARNSGKPVLGLGHQYAFGTNTPKQGYSIIDKTIMRHFAPATIGLGLHWYPYNSNVLPPIIDTQLQRFGTPGESIVVYLPFENQASVTSLLQTFPHYQFIQYSPELERAEKNNVSLRKTSLLDFKQDLCAARGVISNCGFELISECIHLGLPVLAKPLQGQFEQHSNALALEQLGYANTTNKLDEQTIAYWLQNLGQHQGVATPYPDVAGAIVKWIMEQGKNITSPDAIKPLIDSTWGAMNRRAQ